MPDVVGVRFKACGKIYDFDASGIDLKEGDSVVVESDFGISIGKVIRARRFIESPRRELKKIMRIVTEEDAKTLEDNKGIEKEALDFCIERVRARGLEMKLVSAETILDKKRIIFYFTADGRVDFRELVKDLAAKFKTRIEMRQIGVRDEAKLIGGIGICGRELCCRTFLTSFEPVSIKMAKKQELTLNVSKLSGFCSRLMCCLRYEYSGDTKGITVDDEIPADEDISGEKGTGGILSVLAKLEKDSSISNETIEDLEEKEIVELRKEKKLETREDTDVSRAKYRRRRFRR